MRSRRIDKKTEHLCLKEGGSKDVFGTERKPVPADRQDIACLTDGQIGALVAATKDLRAKAYNTPQVGAPTPSTVTVAAGSLRVRVVCVNMAFTVWPPLAQDVEFAFKDGTLYILQSRPITTLA